jgi:hypothetical protein
LFFNLFLYPDAAGSGLPRAGISAAERGRFSARKGHPLMRRSDTKVGAIEIISKDLQEFG